MGTERTEGRQIAYALKMAVITMALLLTFGMIMGLQFFGEIISITGLALIALLFYAVR